ncbi:MAG TPA: helix-turn-helix domain-containing protein [Steroidobacteraceae bacterium]|nr:helix-turn-helix domain-containing protein [Steroidobacteraceae bacterium]
MSSDARLFSLEQVAERLGLQVRTVRSYVRSGRLKAIRIGKQYRVTRDSLEDLTGPAPLAVPRHRHVEVSSVIQVDAVSQETAGRVTNHLAAGAKAARDGSALRVEAIYDEERSQLKVIVIGSLLDAANVFRLLGALLEA